MQTPDLLSPAFYAMMPIIEEAAGRGEELVTFGSGETDLKHRLADRWDAGSRDVVQMGRGKMFDTRGICMTPGVRAAGPSYMKPLPPPVQRPADVRPHEEPPLVIVRTVANRQEIVACSDAAMTFGIRAGLTLTEARALCAKVVAFVHDPVRDARALEGLGRWMTRFTPFVSLPPLPGGERAGVRGESQYIESPSIVEALAPHPDPSPLRGEGVVLTTHDDNDVSISIFREFSSVEVILTLIRPCGSSFSHFSGTMMRAPYPTKNMMRCITGFSWSK